MSSAIASPRGLGLYGAAAVLVALELWVGWTALHPRVPPDYRAYYIDQTTTCLDHPVSGAYDFGTAVSFRSPGYRTIQTLRVCGWDGPAGDGLHAVGESSRLRFVVPPEAKRLVLTLSLVAIEVAPGGREPVVVSINGVETATLSVAPGRPQRFSLAVPAAAAPVDGGLTVDLAYPQAVTMVPQDSNTRKRSIKLTMARLAEASAPPLPRR